MELVAWLTELMHCAQPLVAHAGSEADPAVQPDGPWGGHPPSYLERLLWNLLSNAVKYTPSGGEVTVTLRAAAGQVLLTVADSGVGIPPEQQAHLFDGYLEKPRMPPPHRVLGLGLPLCQAIARGHGGRLLLQSGPEGTTVTVSLPDRRCTKTVLREPPFAYGGGFHPVLLGLADAVPYTAFTRKNLD
ncbi:MAG: sensor histidine kinase [Dysosmobacter sp.]